LLGLAFATSVTSRDWFSNAFHDVYNDIRNLNPSMPNWDDSFKVIPKIKPWELPLTPYVVPDVNKLYRSQLFTSGRDPLILDLTGNGIHTVGNDKSNTMFDFDGKGTKIDVAWTAAGSGFLVYDPTDSNKLADGTQLFGTSMTLANGAKATDGFQALAALDSNGDGHINVQDAAFNHIKVWVGDLATGQMKTLSDLGITDISLSSSPLEK